MPTIYLRFPSVTFTSPASRYPPLLTAGLWLVGLGAVLWLAGALTLGHWGAAALAAGLLALLLAAPIALVLPVTRRVLEAGQTHQDLVQAVRDDVERQHKTLAFQFGAGETRTERLARRAAYAEMGLFGLGGAAGMLVGGLALDAAMGAMVVGAFTAVGEGAVAATRLLRRRDVTGERWLRFWSSRLGEWVARLAGLGLRRLPAGAPPSPGVTTAFALAAERLLRNLPPQVRERLSDLPDELRRLEQRTGGVRRWIEEIDTPLTIERDVSSQDLAKARHAAESWLTASVSALEAIQRELERLHEGAGTVEGVTAELEAAREIGEAVDRVLEGRREVGDA